MCAKQARATRKRELKRMMRINSFLNQLKNYTKPNNSLKCVLRCLHHIIILRNLQKTQVTKQYLAPEKQYFRKVNFRQNECLTQR